MSDTGRMSATDKAKAALKVRCYRAPRVDSHPDILLQPDSEKSTTEHMGDKFKGKSDSAASSLQPQSEKSTTQKVGDAFSSNSNENQVRECSPP